MTENYLTLLAESLKKKLQVMAEIQAYNLRQQEIFQAEQVEVEKFDEYVAEKESLIEKINSLDNGFERLYEKAAAELNANREKYGQQIKELQKLVTEVTDASVAVQAQEARNKKLIEDFFRREREGIGMNRRTSKAAINYYKNMSKSAVVLPQFMDSKK